MTKPSEIVTAPAATPSTIKVEKKAQRKSEPVRNPAFREHEGLRNLQKQLHAKSNRPSNRTSK